MASPCSISVEGVHFERCIKPTEREPEYRRRNYAYSREGCCSIDGWACVGTANFDKLSLQINRELNLGTSHPETVKQVQQILFELDFKISTEITEPVSLDLRDHIIELIADET